MQIKRRAFTLIEILVVILIIALVYSLVVTAFNQSSKKSLNLTNLKKNIIRENPNQNVEFVCVNSCKECYFKLEDELSKAEEIPPLDTNLEVFSFDIDSNEIKKSFPKLEDNEVCFRYFISKKGISEPIIIKNFDKYYFLPSYFGEVAVFENFSEAKEAFFNNSYSLSDLY